MKGSVKEHYISVDVEASGPIPGDYSLLSLGACSVIDPRLQFYVEIQPISDKAVPEALAVAGFTLEHLKKTGTPPATAMSSFADWIKINRGEGNPVFVGFNACFDWSFVNWYFHRFLGRNPFGIGGVDIKAFYMGRAGCMWSETTLSRLPATLISDLPHTHNALEDALAQAEIFAKLLALPSIPSPRA